ncbi:MAG: gamma-glutamyltransferase, partial [Terriglobales bacterium]
HGTYRGYEIISAPPPSSGGTALIEMLNILEGFDLGKDGDHTAKSVHLITEAFRRAYYDRADFMGDPDFTRVPVAQLIDKRYGTAWREGLDQEKATPSADLKRPAVFSELDTYAVNNPCENQSAVVSSQPPERRIGILDLGFGNQNPVHAIAGNPNSEIPNSKSLAMLPRGTIPCMADEPEDTTHYSIVDAQGNAVAVTTTLNGIFGSYVTADGLGFLLNNEMDDFSSAPGVPNSDGLIQGPANAIGAGKRPLSSMTPTIVLRPALQLKEAGPTETAGKPQVYLVLGSPGGARIITTVANILMGVIDFGLDIQQAVNAPRFHHQWSPDKLVLEPGFPIDTAELLQAMGHETSREKYWSDGECILVDSRTGERLGASDGRNNGKALGY